MTRLRSLAAAALALALAACVSVLPDAEPATLYRLDPAPAGAQAPALSAPRATVLKTPSVFVTEAATDRIMTVDGGTVAYLAGSRWTGPAPILFDEALTRAFETRSARTRLAVAGSGGGKADLILRLEVRDFAAYYDNGGNAAPVVTIRVSGALVRRSSGAVVAERLFTARARAGENRVSTVVAAFQAANTEVLGEIVEWVDAAS